MKKTTFTKIVCLVMLCGGVWILANCWLTDTHPPLWFSYAAIVLTFILSPIVRLFPSPSIEYEISVDKDIAMALAEGSTVRVTLVEE